MANAHRRRERHTVKPVPGFVSLKRWGISMGCCQATGRRGGSREKPKHIRSIAYSSGNNQEEAAIK